MSVLSSAVRRVKSTPVGALMRSATTRRKLDAYVATHSVRKLHLGCGGRLLPGWLNSDLNVSWRELFDKRISLIEMDCTRHLPLPSDSFDFIYSEHMHEHLDYASACLLLKEIGRVLKPNGRVRISLPDLNFYFQMFESNRSYEEFPVAFKEQIWRTDGLIGAPLDKVTFLNFLFRGSDHKYIYSRDSLKSQFEAAGFEQIKICAPGQSDTPALRDLETNAVGREKSTLELHLSYTTAIEGTKPASSFPS